MSTKSATRKCSEPNQTIHETYGTLAVGVKGGYSVGAPVGGSGEVYKAGHPRVSVPFVGAIRREGAVTREFFADGERAEANHWENSPLVRDDADGDPELEFRSFDRIPRRRGPLVAATVAATILLGAGLATSDASWWSPLAGRNSPVALALAALRPERKPAVPIKPRAMDDSSSPAASPSLLVPLAPVSPSAPSVSAAVTSIVAATSPPASISSEPAVAATTDSRGPIAPLSVRPQKRAGEKPRTPDSSSPRRTGSSALHGYVWSPHEQRLVPSGATPAND